MKRLSMIMMCLFTMMAASTSVKAQEITITISPGWNWISCPMMDTLDFTTAMGSFIPMQGDLIKSRYAFAEYYNNEWHGNLQQFYPGLGYHYKSNRTEPVTVTFQVQQPIPQVVVTISELTDITTTSAVVGSTVTIGEGNHIYARGVCWDTVQMPTMDDNHTSDGADTGVISTILTGLTQNTTFFVRAYAVTDYGLTYGEEQSFTTLDSSGNVPEGAINGLFTINANGDQVYFSQGNLQFHASTNTWRFAENQWDYVGTQTPDLNGNVGGMVNGSDNRNISQFYDGWIDLFGWGTSGFNHGAVCYQPWSSINTIVYYYAYGSYTYNLYDQTGQADWGYNIISNGGNFANWRTLTQPEWNYLFNTRNTASGIRYVKANVNGVNGVILLPDDWSNNVYYLSTSYGFSSNVLTTSQWIIIENAGAVFLPAAGYRSATSVGNVGSYGYYWSSTYYDSDNAYDVYINDNSLIANDILGRRFYGQSVRLVKDYNP